MRTIIAIIAITLGSSLAQAQSAPLPSDPIQTINYLSPMNFMAPAAAVALTEDGQSVKITLQTSVIYQGTGTPFSHLSEDIAKLKEAAGLDPEAHFLDVVLTFAASECVGKDIPSQFQGMGQLLSCSVSAAHKSQSSIQLVAQDMSSASIPIHGGSVNIEEVTIKNARYQPRTQLNINVNMSFVHTNGKQFFHLRRIKENITAIQ